MNDASTNISDLKAMVRSFCEKREWDQFHSPKDLAIGISTESSELLQLFRFKNESEVELMMKDCKTRSRICEELSDTFYFVLRFAQMNEIDLSNELSKKMTVNSEKYPIDTFRGSNRKYTEI